MPMTRPLSLNDDEVYSLTGHVLWLNGLWPNDATAVDAHSLPRVAMPNRNGFVGDPRPGGL